MFLADGLLLIAIGSTIGSIIACLVSMAIDYRCLSITNRKRLESAWKDPVRLVTKMKPGLACFKKTGSYYPQVTYADELWDRFYVEACEELDAEFPNGRLLPDKPWSLGLSPLMIKTTKQQMEVNEIEDKFY